jgi:antitoxin component of MazEF toxin-antitoxin module
MKFKAKLFRLGNAKGIYIPKEVYTELEEGRIYEFEVYTDKSGISPGLRAEIKTIEDESITIERDDSTKKSGEFGG